jgi:hypothetical protein
MGDLDLTDARTEWKLSPELWLHSLGRACHSPSELEHPRQAHHLPFLAWACGWAARVSIPAPWDPIQGISSGSHWSVAAAQSG